MQLTYRYDSRDVVLVRYYILYVTAMCLSWSPALSLRGENNKGILEVLLGQVTCVTLEQSERHQSKEVRNIILIQLSEFPLRTSGIHKVLPTRVMRKAYPPLLIVACLL